MAESDIARCVWLENLVNPGHVFTRFLFLCNQAGLALRAAPFDEEIQGDRYRNEH
jgi:hypothetical protein